MQLDLLTWEPPPASVIERCRAQHGAECIKIYAKDMQTVVRTQPCRVWCPLLNEVIE